MQSVRKKSISSNIISTYFLLSFVLVFLIMCIVYLQFKNVIQNNVLESNSDFIVELLDRQYAGDWRVEGEKLYKGDKIINEDYQMLDSIKNITKADVTIFLNDTRINTTVVKDGQRQVGTKAAQNVVDKVLKEGTNYNGTADVVGKKYVTIYKPIKDSTGKAIGMIFIGYPESYVFGIIKTPVILIIAISLLVLSLGATAFYLIIRRNVIKPIEKLNKNLNTISDLDFKVTVDKKLLYRRDEVGDMFNSLDKMMNTLKEMVKKLSDSSSNLFEEANSLTAVSQEMAASSEQVASSVEQVASGAQEQSTSIDEIMLAFEKLSNAMDEAYVKLNSVKKEVQSTEQKASIGKNEMDKLILSIEDIRAAFNTVAEKLNTLNASVYNISSIADVIKGISEQTNLLALNAAIEASRAGEAGRGFAVVADEVRKLAEESKKSTDEIVNIINMIQAETKEVLETSNNVERFIDNQKESVKATVSSFTDILSSVENITPLINATTEYVDEMIEYKDETVSKIESVNQIATENLSVVEEVSSSSEELSASSEEVASASEKLLALADGLKDVVNSFKI
ncbi:methyl-accepting chemotaxis protein [Caloramator proteoclasticus]|uniref:Methyl-accepting chemotaxis protein n=1 Tax=Caloramator proteoclasticus DSM 10124 TaxID=1121262 RepID=A0A1M5AJ13_9CLOT|nr:methyl-accepting chemotaxis protein [Caloramator proteoclasticus]SHF30269.1 methyl-accepting chemotaxis protein [Caloramator proteoclasticus DSM 10124]